MELETNNIIVGAGLISLDVLIWDGQRVPISYYVGGTCGNVMMILSHMGWDAYPIARLDGTKDGVRVTSLTRMVFPRTSLNHATISGGSIWTSSR